MKKAIISLNLLIWLPRIIFLIFLIVIVTQAISNYANIYLDTSQPEATIITYRITNTLAHQDQYTRRTYPLQTSLDDTKKIHLNTLQQEFTTPTLSARAALTIGEDTTTFYHNKERYERLANIPSSFLHKQAPHYNSTYPLQPTGKLNINIYTQ